LGRTCPCAPPSQPAACNSTGRTGSDLYPAISVYKGQDTTSPQDHVFNPIGNFWATKITYFDSSYKSDRVTHVLVYKKKLSAGKYTIDIGGAGARSPYCHEGDPCYSGGVDVGKVKTPVLRGLAGRPPYFHNGSAKDLATVISFYNARFNIGLTPQESRSLMLFLLAL
jgi:cytochrome c peroxidase